MTETPQATRPLSPSSLCIDCDPGKLGFASTDDLGDLDHLIGQQRAVDAINLSVSTGHRDFNVFVQGTPGSGRHSTVREILSDRVRGQPVPDDWVYVNNFQDPHKPRSLRLPPGTGVRLRQAMEMLIDDLANDIPALFDSEDYQSQRHAIEQKYTEGHERRMNELNDLARSKNTSILRTPMGIAVAATRDGEVIAPRDYDALSEEERETLKANVADIQQRLEAVMKQVPRSERAQRQEVRNLNASMVARGVEDTIEEVVRTFPDLPEVAAYLQEVRADVIENAELFLMSAATDDDGNFPLATAKHYEHPRFQRYAVNVMVSHRLEDAEGAPVVVEDFPTLANLIGRIEHVQMMGALTTNFTMIKPGALHRANGGYLILDARQVLSEPFAWETLKRCLKSEAISIISVGEKLSLITTTSLDPDPIPLNVRVVLVGERLLYFLLVALDPDFPTLFKIQADFNDDVPVSEESTQAYSRLIASIARRTGVCPLDAPAVARLIGESARLAGDAERLTLNVSMVSDILKEADHCARAAAKTTIGAGEINAAVDQAEARASRIRELMQDQIVRGAMKIDTDGAATGQINALSVLEIGGFRFGRPSRITARVRMGSGKVVDIEREVELGGPLHSKGVLILSGYLGANYAVDAPMSLWASIVFEQSYGGIDGDSASAAELFTLLSALSGCPIDQSFAVTGSVNQFGEIQAIGGVNEKIEGFFDICAARGLTGRQGVLIPMSNVRNLALRQRVIDAVARGDFRIIPIETIDQGIALLTGMPAGERGTDGQYPQGSVNRAVEDRLHLFAEQRRKYGAGAARGNNEPETPT